MSTKKTWIVLGDIHDNIEKFSQIPELREASGIIISGDLTNNGHIQEAQKIIDAIRQSDLPVLAQIGNMDFADVDDYLSKTGINLHGKTLELAPQIAIFGVGGSTPTPFNTPSEYGEDQYERWLADEWKKVKDYPATVLVSHNPPKNTACDDIGGNVHVGSTAVRKFIEDNQPTICICGHIHEARATDMIGDTMIINPGQFGSGGYALIIWDGEKLSAKLAQI